MSFLRIGNIGETLTVDKFQNYIKNIELTEMGFKANSYTDSQVNSLQQKINKFKLFNFNNMTEDDIFDKICDVLKISGVLAYTPEICTLRKNETLYRVRKIEAKYFPNSFLKSVSDCWNPPESVVGLGRLNKAKESLLYTTLGNPLVAMKEARINKQDRFMLMIYKVNRDINFSLIGKNLLNDNCESYSDNVLKVNNIYNEFLNEYFTKAVDKDEDKYYYKLTEILAKRFFSIADEGKNIWGYNTILNNKYINLCFEPKIARNSLELMGVLLSQKIGDNNIKIHSIVEKFDKGTFPIYTKRLKSSDLFRYFLNAIKIYGV